MTKLPKHLNDSTNQPINIILLFLPQLTLRYAPAYAEATQYDKLLISDLCLLFSVFLPLDL